MPLHLVTVPCLADNYAFLIHDIASKATAVVDVPEAAPILAALHAQGWVLGDILITHHHNDHIGGVAELRAATGARVTGAAADAHRLPPLDRGVSGGDRVTVGAANGHVIEVPGHTIGHIAFHFPDDALLFTADSLMAGGCGRLFEGTADQMHDSLGRLARLPPRTQICSGHEYTASNLAFAQTLEPDNPDLILRIEAVRTLRAAGRATVPSLLSEELATNPFLRAHLPALKAALGLPDATDSESFAEIRRRKDRF